MKKSTIVVLLMVFLFLTACDVDDKNVEKEEQAVTETLYIPEKTDGNDQSESVEQIGIETAWQNLKETYFDTSELNEISYDEDHKLNVVIYRGEMEFSDGEEPRPCENIVFFDHQEDDEYIFGNYMVFYDGKDVYGLRTRGWYSVNAYTGEAALK